MRRVRASLDEPTPGSIPSIILLARPFSEDRVREFQARTRTRLGVELPPIPGTVERVVRVGFPGKPAIERKSHEP